MTMSITTQDIVVVTPVYKATLSDNEARSVAQGRLVLSRYRRVLVCPQSLDVGAYLAIDADLQIERFDNECFMSIKAYNQLMMSSTFYYRFLDFKYLLIYQTDAWVFRDELLQWCARGYSYVGAPWVAVPASAKKTLFNFSNLLYHQVGNGGFCIRRVAQHYRCAILFRPLSWLFGKNEDFFWCYIVKKVNPWYAVPSWIDALHFGFELNPSDCYQQLNKKLPFGCHAWEKYEPEFWATFIR